MAQKRNVAKNPKLWSQAKALARSKFDVYPCVPLNSLAITKNGLENYFNLNLGEEILSYNLDKNELIGRPFVDRWDFCFGSKKVIRL